MRYDTLGSSGLLVSAVGIGCNAFGRRVDQAGVDAIVNTALDEGINLFDTADVYSLGISEQMLGKALGRRRDEAVVATKFGMDMQGANGADHGVRGSRRYILKAVEASLQRLQTDHIDLFQLHAPDPVTPLEETLSALDDLVRAGKVRYLGSSQFAAWEVVNADWTAASMGAHRFVSTQAEYSLYNRSAENELVPALETMGVGLLPFFPLGYGLLTGKYRRGEGAPAGTRLARETARYDDADFDRVEALAAYAAERDLSLLEVAIGGLAAQPAVASVIAGVTRPEQVRENVAALDWDPDLADLAVLDEIVPPGTGPRSVAL